MTDCLLWLYGDCFAGGGKGSHGSGESFAISLSTASKRRDSKPELRSLLTESIPPPSLCLLLLQSTYDKPIEIYLCGDGRTA